MKRRASWRALLACFLTFAVTSAPAAPGLWPGIGWGTGGLLPGFFPVGHWMASPTGQGLTPVFPVSGAASTARQSWAYWDGTNDIPYDIAIGVEFGAYPYVFTLLSGPPGMTIEQPIYTTFQNPQYGRILWHPQGNISSNWSGTVSVLVTDQQLNTITLSWSLATDDTTTHFVFASPSGNGSTCSYSVPCSLTQAFGPTFASTSYPGAIVYAEAGTYSSSAAQFTGTINNGSGGSGTTLTVSSGLTGTVAIGENCGAPGSSAANGTVITAGSGTSWTVSISQNVGSSTIICSTNLPAYTDTDSGSPSFEPYVARKPDALIGIPGQTITLDGTQNDNASYPHFIQIGTHGQDWYMENIGENGYDSLSVVQQIILGNSARQTYDQDTWANSGFGSGSSGNMSWFVSASSQSPRQYLFITDSTESGRESGTPGNNMGFLDLYAYQYALVQRDSENSPGASLNAAFYYKIDELNSTLRENYVNASPVFAFAGFGSQDAGNGENDNDYNLIISPLEIEVGGSSNFTWQGFAFYRNTVLSGSGQGMTNAQTAYNLEGPGNDGLIGASGTTGGSLTPTTSYTCGVTSVGNSGESQTIIGSYGSASGGNGGPAGTTNQKVYVLPGGDSAITLTWLAEPGAIGYNVYCEVTGSGTWTEYSAGNVTSYLYTGAAGTLASPPSSSTAIANGQLFVYESNAFATTNAISPPPTGAAIVAPTYPTSLFNIVDSVGASGLICLNTTTTGCTTGQIGDLNTAYSGSFGAYSSLIGQVGYRIQ